MEAQAISNMQAERKTDYPVEDLFVNRWSRRAIQEKPVSHETLMRLFEAAKWAPSSYNNQPWRFTYANKGTKHWDEYFQLLDEGNQEWAQSAPVLLMMISNTVFEKTGKKSRTHSFDCGAAWQCLALQATSLGLVAHAMEGFDYDGAKRVADIPDHYQVEAMAAVGYPGTASKLPPHLQKLEIPSQRKALTDIAFEGKVPKWQHEKFVIMT